jgi:THO complex subunit 1
LSDLAFQRHILVQGLILLDYLLSFTEKAKKKLAAKKGAVKAQFTLSEADASPAVRQTHANKD